MSEHHSPDAFDARMRQLHAQSLAAMPPPTLARLRQARHAAGRRPRRRLPAWLLATACSALLAVGFGLQLHRDGETRPSPSLQAPTAAASDDDAFDQNPDLYVWLGSENALAME